MSHRRKNAHPTNKLRRSTVPDSPSVGSSGSVSDADSNINSKMVSKAEDLAIRRDSTAPSSTPHLTKTFTSSAAPTTTTTLLPITPAVTLDATGVSTPSVPSHLALPPDLWDDFQALQAATHLDTASLIRRLIHQYGKSGSQAENERPSSATDTDTTICADDHMTSSPGGGAGSGDGETAYYGEQASCLGVGAINMMAATGYIPPPQDLTANQEEDCIILDLSSGSRDVHPPSSSTSDVASDVRMEYPDEAEEEDVERPLDLTVSKASEFSMRRTRGEVLVDKAPEAHRTPTNTILLSALSHGFVHPSSAAVPTHPREAHSVLTTGMTSSPRPVSSSLFNLSDLPLVGQRVSSVAQTEQPQNKLTVSSSSRYSEEMQSKQKIVQQFLSLPAGHFQTSDVQQAMGVGHERQECVLKVTPGSSEGFRHLGGQSSAVPYLTSSPSVITKNVDPSQPAESASSSAAAMHFPTVTSLEFSGLRGVERKGIEGQEEVTLGQSAVAVSLSSLPTSASAIFLDVGSGGLVAGAGGGLTGLSTLNIPFMATGAGGLVAIPLLHHTLSEALAAAAAAATNHGQLPNTSTPSSRHSPHSQPVNDLPPPPPYSAAVAASAQSKKYKAKPGRPRGQPKAQKAAPKDMKLLTENTLFPGVYTSILKLPWSKRSRGKSSVKIKDVIGKSPNTTSLQDQPIVSEHREPGEVTATTTTTTTQQQHQPPREKPPQSSATSDRATFSVVPMPMFVPDQTSTTATVLPSACSSSTSSSSSSVMMVYHNSAMSELGKPVRKRGRPPKLPVLSQLLTENMPYCADRPPEEDQPTPMDTGSFSLIPLAAHPAFDASTVAFPTNVLESSGFAASVAPQQMTAASIKQEPMEVTDAQVSRLFSLAPAVLDRTEDTGHSQLDRQNHQSLKQELDDITVKSGDVREGEQRRTERRNTGRGIEDPRNAEMGDGSVTTIDAKDSDMGGSRLYGFPEVAETGGVEKREGGDGGVQESETRFHMLANQLGLEIGSPYHTSLVYGQSPTAAAKNFLYQPVMLPSQTMVEMKPCRRQLNNLIKPSDDCMYTSFRIRPRNSGRRGGKRGGRRRGTGGRYSTPKVLKAAETEDMEAKEAFYKDGGDAVRPGSGSAVITERIPGADEVPQRLYQDLYHCKVCKELLPVDNSLPHTCAPPRSPPLCSCDVCGTMFLSSASLSDGSALPKFCEDCTRKIQPHPLSAEDSSQDQTFSEGFACQPCGVHFVNISDYIQHRRSAHLEKMSRQARKTHTLKTLPCPARGCPRLFHMHAELSRHLLTDHPEDAGQIGLGIAAVEDAAPTPSPSQQESCQDVDVETVLPDKETETAEEDPAQFPCSQEDCDQRFSTAFQLLEHMQACHEGVSHWPCPLPGCSRQFGTERHLRVHLLMHKDEKPLRCPFCPYRCRQKNALQWHMRKHPESTGQHRKFAGMSMDS
ncbi:hypothetical protein ACOMHN_010678 [Nucella lapillus]